MPTETHEGAFKSGTFTTGLVGPHLQIPHAFIDKQSAAMVIVMEVRGEKEAEEVLFVHGYPCWNTQRLTPSSRIAADIYAYSGFSEWNATGPMVGSCLHHFWSPRGVYPAQRRGPQITQTDDSSIKLKGGALASLAESAENVIAWLLPTPPKSTEQTVREPHQEAVEWIKEATGSSWEYIRELLGVSRPTLLAWRQGGPINADHRRRLFATRDVLERAARRNPRPSELAAWLETPRGTAAKTPAELLAAGEIDKARLLAITSSSPGVKAPPGWVRQHMPTAYESSKERVEALPPDRDEELSEILDDANE